MIDEADIEIGSKTESELMIEAVVLDSKLDQAVSLYICLRSSPKPNLFKAGRLGPGRKRRRVTASKMVDSAGALQAWPSGQ